MQDKFNSAAERVNNADRHLTTNTTAFEEALKALDLKDLVILELGCGSGHLLRKLRNSAAKIIYAFETKIDEIDPDIRAWAKDKNAVPRLIINPEEANINTSLPEGDFTNCDFVKLLGDDKFAIISNPPYFLWNRVLSLTGEYLAPEDKSLEVLRDNYVGTVGFTSSSRITNHPGVIVRAVLHSEDFTPPAATGSEHCLIQTGFDGRYHPERSKIPAEYAPSGIYTKTLYTVPQRYVSINNRHPRADKTDYYPGWGEETETGNKVQKQKKPPVKNFRR